MGFAGCFAALGAKQKTRDRVGAGLGGQAEEAWTF